MKRIINYPFKIMRRLYDWTVGWAHKKSSGYALFVIAFIESSFFPIPPDVLLIPLVVADPKNWWKKALICTAGSVLGAFLGYFIGVFLFDTIGIAIVNFYNLQEGFASVQKMYADNAFLAVFTAGFTPVPYKVFTIASGVFKVSLVTLLFASILSRGGRFFIVAGAIRIFGKQIQYVIEKYFNILSVVFIVLLVAGFVCVKYLLK